MRTWRELEEAKAKIALVEAFAKAVGLKPGAEPTPRQRSMMGYSDETKRIIIQAIEVNPAMEETFLKIAELAYADGEDSDL
jgi:hypothetical protein